MNCPMCDSKNYRVLEKNFTSYVENLKLDIFICNNCLSNFTDPSKVDKNLYELVYSDSNTEGYDRYYQTALKIKSSANPLKYLGGLEADYYAVYNYMKDKKNLNVLEIGCGYGYTTYAVAKLGNNVTGIDLSKKSIEFAMKELKLPNSNYINVNIFDYKPSEKYDVIYSTDVFEHFTDTNKFIEKAKSLLNPNGKIIITTTNKDYHSNLNPETIWENDLPPVHVFWPTKKGLELFIQNNGLTSSFLDMGLGIYPNMNALIEFKRAYRNNPRPSLITKNGTAILSKESEKKSIKTVLRDISYLTPFRYFSAFIVNKILNYKDLPTIALIASK
jgi:ubiquinone biosynthesis O-methyltransferase